VKKIEMGWQMLRFPPQLFGQSSRMKLLSAIVTIFTLFVALPRIGVFTRFPGEDLYWNDLQILNSWRWLSNAIREGGLSQAIFGSIDFRQNTGDAFAASSKWPSQFIDVGAWHFFLFNDLNLAYTFKFVVYALLSAGSVFRLIQQNPYMGNRSESAKLIFFGVLYASLILHPILFGEVGPLNQMYLLLIPCWFEFLKNANDRFERSMTRSIARLMVITFASLAGSDLFFIASISAIFLTLYLHHLSSKHELWLLFRIHLIVLGIFVLDKSYFIVQLLINESQISHKGSWTPLVYWELFLRPALLNSVLYPEYVGPSSIFLNSLLIALIIFSLRGGKPNIFRSFFFCSALTFILLCSMGLLMHAIEDVRVNLPSAIRYHLTFLPSLLVSIVASYGRMFLFSKVKPKKSEYGRTSLGLVSAILIVLIVSYLSNSSYGGKVSDYYAINISKDLGRWYGESLPNCINTIIDQEMANANSRSFMLVKRSNSENLMDDSLLIIGEQPQALRGRTFHQWRYSSGILNHNELAALGKSGLFSRPFLATDTVEILNFGQKLMIPYILSTEKLSGSYFRELGRCNFPSKFNSIVERNDTLGATIFVSQIQNSNNPSFNPILSSSFDSSKATFRIACDRLESSQVLKLPINFNQDIVSKIGNVTTSTAAGENNALEVDLSYLCNGNDELELDLTSHSRVVGFKNMIYFCSFLLLLIGLGVWLNRSRRQD
jgi:hypothetical protein